MALELETLRSKGTQVEVRSDQEGFKGAWFLGKIINSPPKTRKGKALIEYESLFEDDEKTLLKEYVDPSFIRPLPPLPTESKEPFEVLDVVDGYYNDCWWEGVITQVKDVGEGGKENMRYTVTFESPPHHIEFGPSDLRFHFDWVDGSWVKPEKQKGTVSNANGQKQSGRGKVAAKLNHSRVARDTVEGRNSSTFSGKNRKQQSRYKTACKSKKVKETTPKSVRSCPSMKRNQEAEPSAKHESPVRVKIAESNLDEVAAGNEIMLSVGDGKIPSKLLVKGQPVLREGEKKNSNEGCFTEAIAEVECITKEADLSIGLAEGMRGSCSDVDTLNAASTQQQPLLASTKSPNIAGQLENSSVAKGDNDENTPYNTIYPRKRENLTTCKNVKQTSLNSEPILSPPCKRIRVGSSGICLSSLECRDEINLQEANDGEQMASFPTFTATRPSGIPFGQPPPLQIVHPQTSTQGAAKVDESTILPLQSVQNDNVPSSIDTNKGADPSSDPITKGHVPFAEAQSGQGVDPLSKVPSSNASYSSAATSDPSSLSSFLATTRKDFTSLSYVDELRRVVQMEMAFKGPWTLGETLKNIDFVAGMLREFIILRQQSLPMATYRTSNELITRLGENQAQLASAKNQVVVLGAKIVELEKELEALKSALVAEKERVASLDRENDSLQTQVNLSILAVQEGGYANMLKSLLEFFPSPRPI